MKRIRLGSDSDRGWGGSDHPSAIHGYAVLRALGRGAASRLFAVVDPDTRQVYALKRVVKREARDQRFLDQAEQEHAITSPLQHPGIRRSRRIIRIRPRLRVNEILLLLDFVDGQPLDATPSGPAPLLRRLAEVSRALVHLHSKGIVHADLKPGNILVGADGEVTLIDFGQACEVGTAKRRVQGTPGFMAPEQRERAPLVPETDVFALGATLLQMLLAEGGRPDELPRGAELVAMTAHRALAHDRLLEIDAGNEIATLVATMLDPLPGRRPRDLAAIARTLEQIADRLPSAVPAAA